MPRSPAVDANVPLTIDGMAFARDGGRLTGAADTERMPRVAESGASGVFQFTVEGRTNSMGRPALRVVVAGSASMTCQSCLDAVVLPVAIDAELELREDLREIELAEDDTDRALASRAMDVVALVEDEVLLALPMVPRHEVCEGAAAGPVIDDRVRPNPFAALAGRGRKQ